MNVVLEFQCTGIRNGMKIFSHTSPHNGTFHFNVSQNSTEKVSDLFLQHLEAESIAHPDQDYAKYLVELKTRDELIDKII